MEIEKIYSSQNLSKEFKELVMQECDYKQNILYFIAGCYKIDFHKFFWNFFIKYFDSQEDLMNYVLKKNKFKHNFIHKIVEYQHVPIRELTFKILKENLTSDQYKQVMQTKNREKRNILQIAAYTRHLRFDEHKVTWKIVRESCETDKEFLEIVNEGDWDGTNILCNAVNCQSPDVIKFMIEELEKICTREELTKFLCGIDVLRRNLLLLAAMSIKSLDVHIFLWNMFEKYVEPSQIFENIQPCIGEYRNNILLCAVYENKLEVVQFIWNKIKALITNKEEQMEYLRTKNTYGEDITTWSRRNHSNPRVHKWVKILLSQYGILNCNVNEINK
jgi:hypothetical protein